MTKCKTKSEKLINMHKTSMTLCLTHQITFVCLELCQTISKVITYAFILEKSE